MAGHVRTTLACSAAAAVGLTAVTEQPVTATDDVVVAASAAEPRAPDRDVVAALGDSVTAGYGLDHPRKQSYPAKAGIDGYGVPASCAVDDDTCYVSPMPEWFADAVDDMRPRPDTVVVLIGINDIGLGQSYATIVDAYRALVRQGRRLGVRVVFGTLLPTSRAFRHLARVRGRVNRWIRSQDTYVDYADDLRHGQWLEAKYDSGDGGHPNARGHRRMARTLRAWIRAQEPAALTRP